MDAGNGEGRAVAAINVTPMIDVLLVLLIIFMVIVPQAPKGLNSQIPQPSKSTDRTPPDVVVVEVLPDRGSGPIYRINQTTVSRSQVAAELRTIFAPRRDRTMFVKGDSALSFRDVAEVVDMGHAAGVENVGLLTAGVNAGLTAEAIAGDKGGR
jgi:biopolymer transport protein ExbD/biopolymer transport protein TolR